MSQCSKRIFREIQKINNDPNRNFNIFLNDNFCNEEDNENYITLKVIINVIDNCPYKRGKFLFEFHFPKDYPFKSPIIKLINKIYHPNFKGSGDYIFHKHCHIVYDEIEPCIFENLFAIWSPINGIMQILSLIYSTLINPSIEPNNIINEDCANLMKDDIDEYAKIAKEWTEKYANEIFTNNINANGLK